jgi:peptidoglycan hydrolase-like protein with peptidoglycan-binding domain
MYLKDPDHKQTVANGNGSRLGSGQHTGVYSYCLGRLGREGIGSLHATSRSVGTIAADDYIKWVQRSLNRLYKVGLPINGRDSAGYRNAVRDFNKDHLGREDYDKVDEKTQNQLIYVNMAVGDYVEWLIKALNKVGYGPLDVTRVLDSSHIKAIKAFQASRRPKIKADGYVGSKTELALIQASGFNPPGHIVAPTGNDPKRRPSTWKLNANEERNIRNHYGEDILDWIKIPPNGIEVKEFTRPPRNLRDNYKTIFVWKSDDARKGCGPFNKRRVHILALLRDDKKYWDERTKGKRVASEILRTTQATAIRDYRKLVLSEKRCPPSAYLQLVEDNRDVIYVAIVGLFGFMARFVTGARTGHHLPKPEVLARAIATFVKLHF